MAGASVYLTKPVEQEKLKEVIRQFLPNAPETNG
jgi:twitching motility two-component system response regulator PilG